MPLKTKWDVKLFFVPQDHLLYVFTVFDSKKRDGFLLKLYLLQR